MANSTDLSPIPDKLYFSIGEVASLCELKAHVLRYWEQEFPQLSPSKRRGNRRYYQRKDVLMVREIKDLLYNKGYTIEGARTQLSGNEDSMLRTFQHSHAKLQSAIKQLEKVVGDLETV
ncbi:MAG: transcriptional regulator [Gammaproteobacteria bacterium RIFCSPHIGHO2_12_FULL_42_13]|nr:MAG: transcriptional regulator [Gammaproteobacteria bacterium RIFCSPHIGHO2_12_FULL_42_13]